MKKIYTRLIPLAVFGMSVGLLWDAWWHVAVGREAFWIPPHDMIYICLAILLCVSFFAWRETKATTFRSLFYVSLLFPITGILDQIWHEAFGIENLASPIVVWSPPHLMILASLIAITLYTRKVVSLDENPTLRWLMRCGVFAGIFGFAVIFCTPFYPLGSYHIIGFWGAGVLSFVWVLLTLYEQEKIKQPGTVFLITALFSLLASMGPGSLVKPAPEIIIGVFYLPPAWLFTFCFMGAAIFLEFAHYWNTIIKGTIAGLLSGLIYYITASSFIDMPGYGVNEKIIAVVSCALGGFIASVLMMTFGKARLQKQMNPAEN